MNHLRDLAVAGRFCNGGHYTQALKTYLKLASNGDELKMSALHVLATVRENVLDFLYCQHGIAKNETVETKRLFSIYYGDELGLIFYKTFYEMDPGQRKQTQAQLAEYKKTGEVLKDGFAKLSEAQKWLEEYETALRG